jgi:hypothetical protein
MLMTTGNHLVYKLRFAGYMSAVERAERGRGARVVGGSGDGQARTPPVLPSPSPVACHCHRPINALSPGHRCVSPLAHCPTPGRSSSPLPSPLYI